MTDVMRGARVGVGQSLESHGEKRLDSRFMLTGRMREVRERREQG